MVQGVFWRIHAAGRKSMVGVCVVLATSCLCACGSDGPLRRVKVSGGRLPEDRNCAETTALVSSMGPMVADHPGCDSTVQAAIQIQHDTGDVIDSGATYFANPTPPLLVVAITEEIETYAVAEKSPDANGQWSVVLLQRQQGRWRPPLFPVHYVGGARTQFCSQPSHLDIQSLLGRTATFCPAGIEWLKPWSW